MICSRCGKPLAPGSTLCAACGAPGIAPLRPSGGWAQPAAGGAAAALPYAGFWRRFLAYVIDSFVLGFVTAFAGAFLGGIAGGILGATGSAPEAIAAVGSLIGVFFGILVYWLYFSIMESSGKQGTLGKMALGLAVTDGDGRPVGFGRASGRYFAKHTAELAHFQQTREYVPLELPGGGTPGSTKMAWGQEDLAAARELGWSVEGASYFTYRVDVGASDDGRQAFAACAESDLDGDGKHAAVVVWQPVMDEAGRVVALPPAPPCAHDPALARSPLFELRDPVGRPVRISPDSVF